MIAAGASGAPPTAATPDFHRHEGRGFALALVVALFVALVVGSLANLPTGSGVGVLDLVAIFASALVAGLTWVIVRIFVIHKHDPNARHRRLVVVGIAFGIVLVLGLTVNVELYAGFNVAAFLACLPFTAFALWVLRRVERNRREPWRLVLIAIGWGMVIAPTFALLGEQAYSSLFVDKLSSSNAHSVALAIGAATFEEVPKGLAVVLLFLVFRSAFDDVVSGIVFGAAVGLGFNLSESMLYMGHHGFFAQLWVRQIWGLFTGHVTYTALIGAGIGVARQQKGLAKKLIAIGCGFIIAIAAHFTWDTVAFMNAFPSSGNNAVDLFLLLPLQVALIDGPFFAMVLVLLVAGLRSEGRALKEQMSEEAATGQGAILPDEVLVLENPRLRARARRQVLTGQGWARFRWVGRLQRAQLELAMERWHRARQELDEPLEAEAILRQRVLAIRAADPTQRPVVVPAPTR